ncbi:MAG: serine/threonine protein kinase [Planctomycetales bacterium]|nr:serine/threonine protein kinase [Planctomycetales bacterium]
MRLTFDDIDLGTPIGKGTVGEVYLGKLKANGQVVALKFLQDAVSRDKLVRLRFQREMSILERLDHPHIIRYFGGGEHDGRLFYAMEVLDGGNVRDLLDRYGWLSWQEVASITRQACSALQHAHNYGIIHRDLKPSNLFLDSNAQVKLGDFGIARDTHAADITTQGLTVGTHAYMAPEQIRGEASVTGKADLYSLGCVMFELLTGHKPFQGANFAVLFEQHLFQPAPRVTDFMPNCPAPLANMIDRLLQKSPDSRPFNARAVQAEMLRLLDQASPHLRRQPTDVVVEHGKVADVGAASVVDSGAELLRLKLKPNTERNVSWKALAWFSLATLLLICLVAIAANGLP